MKKLLFICFIFFLGNETLNAQTTEVFETETAGATTFTDNSQNFTITNGPGETTYDIESVGSAGWNGTAPDNQFIDNSSGSPTTNDGSSFTITTTAGTDITIKSFYLFVSKRNLTTGVSTVLTFTGKKDGTTVYTVVKSTGIIDGANFTPNNGFNFINLATEGGSNNSNTAVDELIISSTSNGDYLALDAFTWDVTAACTDPSVPAITATPSTICPSGNSTLTWTGNLNDATLWHIYTTSCGVTQLGTAAGNSFLVTPGSTTTYFIRGEDGAGCVDESTGLCGSTTVTVQDITNPTISCPANQAGTVNGSCNFTLPNYTGFATAADNCGAVTVTQSPAAGTIVGIGTTNITLTATDGSSNTASCNFDVIVTDATNPTITCPANQNEVVSASCNLSLPDYTGSAIAADNCGAVTVTQSPAAGTIVGIGTTNITLTATDGSSNTASCNFDVIVTDAINPTITCPANQNEVVNGSCNLSLPDYTGSAIAADNCGAVTVTQSPAAGTIIGVGTTNITLTATDGSSNTAICNFDVIVTDAINPTITCPANQNEVVSASCNLSLPDYTGSAIAADNCGAVTVTQSPVAGTIIGVGTTNITLTATDGSSNTAICNFDVFVTDGTNPTITCPGNQNESFDVNCNFTLPNYIGFATVADNCNPAPAVTQSPIAGTVISGTTTITLTVDDGSGNTASCTFDVIPADNTNPTITCPANQNESFDVSCNFTLPNYTGLAVVADNCNPAPAVTQSPIAGTVISGTTTITLTADDGSGNTASCTFDVIPADNTNPIAVCQDINVYLDGSGNATIVAADLDGGSTDNCSAIIMTTSQIAFTCSDLGPTNVTLLVADGNGNSDNCVAIVTVLDTISPNLVCLGNQTETAVSACQFTLIDYTVGAIVSATDNCTALPTITQSPVVGTAVGLGITTITLTADDGNGNTTSCNFTLTVSSSATGTLDSTICNGASFVFNGTTYDGTNTAGVETLTGAAANGCDSVVTVTVTELVALTGTITQTICDGDSIVVNGTTYNTTVIGATETFTNVGPNNCDSVVTINLTVEAAIDLTITSSSPTLTANEVGAAYQWLDCDDAYAAIPQATNQSYSATVIGNYAVAVTVGACTDTSACENVAVIGITEASKIVSIYPNPTTGILVIDLKGNSNVISYTITTIDGRVVASNKTAASHIEIDLTSESDGVYFLSIQENNTINTYKIIKN